MSKKQLVDRIMHIIFLSMGLICAASIVLIVGFIFVKGVKPFFALYPDGSKVNMFKFLIGTTFEKGNYGVLGLIINTLFIVFIATLIAMPISVLTALFATKIAKGKIGDSIGAIVELLASIPSIIFGLFGMGIINPLVRDIALLFNRQTAGGVSVISVIIVLVIMMIPTITTISITSMKAVKKDLEWASLALGATKSQTNFKVVLNGAKSGIIAATILGIGRALGEATAVSMVCGGSSKISIGLLNPTSTMTSAMLQDFFETVGIDYDIRFSIGIVLIFIILITNTLLNMLKKRLCKHER